MNLSLVLCKYLETAAILTTALQIVTLGAHQVIGMRSNE